MTNSIELRQLIGEGKFKEALTEIASSLVEMAVTTNLTGSDEEISLRTYFNLASGQIASEVDRGVLEHPNYQSLQDLHERKIAVIGGIWHQNLTVLNNLATMQASGSLPPLAVDNADADDLPVEAPKDEEDREDTPPPTEPVTAGLEVLPEKPAERSTALTADPENESLPPVVVEEEPVASIPSENAIAAAIPATIDPPDVIIEEELEEEILRLSPIPSPVTPVVDTSDAANPEPTETIPETPPQLAIVSPVAGETPNADTTPEIPPRLAIVPPVAVETPPTVVSVEPPAIQTPKIPFSVAILPPPENAIVAEKVVPSLELAPTADIPDNERVDDKSDWDSWLPDEEEVPPEDSTPTPTAPPADNTLIPDWGIWMENQKEGVADIPPPRKEPLTRINEWESFAPDNFGLNSPGTKPANPSATTDSAALPQDPSDPDFMTKFLAALDREHTDDDRKLE
jgi:hypothetical protein